LLFLNGFKGAKMVEFDVVLTKDNIPVIYHDYSVCIQDKSNKDRYFDIGVHQLTYDELKSTTVS
jgi:glycerophosphoryl diester phosphodiesterase